MSNIDKQARQVSRYDLVSGYMQKWPDGEFVYHSDYQALLDELEAKDRRIAEVESQRRMAFMACNRWADKFRESEAKLEAAENRIAELDV